VPSPSCAKQTSRQPTTHLPRNKQTAPSNTTTSITWPMSFNPQHETAPPLDTAQECSCKKNVKTQTSSRKKLKSPNHINTANTIATDCRHMPAKQQPRENHNPLLTPPKASIITPLPNPTTATGVNREFVVSSPSCAVSSPSCAKTTSRQPITHLPRNKQTAPSNTTTSITWPLSFNPQHETAPPLDSAQECHCKQNVTIP